MIKISIIGFGSIGKFVFKKLSEKNIKIQSLICKQGREERKSDREEHIEQRKETNTKKEKHRQRHKDEK